MAASARALAAAYPRVLLAGGTGILAPACRALARAGAAVTVVSRDRARVAAMAERAVGESAGPVRAVEADLTDGAGTASALAAAVRGDGPYDLAVAYTPYAMDAGPLLARVVRGRYVAVLTSEFGAPGADDRRAAALRALAGAAGAAGPADVRALLLGWRTEPGGAHRWHRPDEVAAAALAAAADAGGAEITVLGTLRPWPGRPGH